MAVQRRPILLAQAAQKTPRVARRQVTTIETTVQ